MSTETGGGADRTAEHTIDQVIDGAEGTAEVPAETAELVDTDVVDSEATETEVKAAKVDAQPDAPAAGASTVPALMSAAVTLSAVFVLFGSVVIPTSLSASYTVGAYPTRPL